MSDSGPWNDLSFALKELARAEREREWALDRGGELANWINRARPVIEELMAAYERRIRSLCQTPEDLAKEPWRCAEYLGAETLLANQPIAFVYFMSPTVAFPSPAVEFPLRPAQPQNPESK